MRTLLSKKRVRPRTTASLFFNALILAVIRSEIGQVIENILNRPFSWKLDIQLIMDTYSTNGVNECTFRSELNAKHRNAESLGSVGECTLGNIMRNIQV